MIVGPDVSFYQDDPQTPKRIDFVKMRSLTPFVIIRAGQNIWPDPDFAYNWSAAKAAGLARGSYWFYDSRVDPKSQAQKYKETLGNDWGELPLFADFEENYGGLYKGYENFKEFLYELFSLFPLGIFGIYTAFYYWKDNVLDKNPTKDELDLFLAFPLWIANYGAVKPLVPAPWSADEWIFWQFTETGDGKSYGVESSNIDLNYFNGDIAKFNEQFGQKVEVPPTPFPVVDVTVNTHKGVTLHVIKRFDANCWVHVIDPKIARWQISNCGFRTPLYALQKYDAQIATNGGGWPNVQDDNRRSNEMWVSNGEFMQQPSFIKDNRPYIDVTKDGEVRVQPNAQVIPNQYNSVGFDRLILIDGKFNEAIRDRTTKDARTASGKTSDGKIIILSVEGNDQLKKGLTFLEMASVLSEFGAVEAGNNDGGSSSTVINTALSDTQLFNSSDGGIAPTINHILIFAEEIGSTILIPDPIPDPTPEPIPPEGGDMQVEVIHEVSSRLNASMDGSGISLPVGTKFISNVSKIVTVKVDGTPYTVEFYQKDDDKRWVPRFLGYTGITYLSVTDSVPDTPPPSGATIVKSEVTLSDGSVVTLYPQ